VRGGGALAEGEARVLWLPGRQGIADKTAPGRLAGGGAAEDVAGRTPTINHGRSRICLLMPSWGDHGV
jgi:hypothetical protein